MMFLKHIKILPLFLFFLFCISLYCSSHTNLEISSRYYPTIVNNHHIFAYSRSGGDDLYQTGETYGRLYLVHDSGKLSIYKLPYKQSPQIDRSFFLKKEKINKLICYINQSGFMNFSEYYPLKSSAPLREPAESIRFGSRESNTQNMKWVKIHMGADKRDYPVYILQFIQDIEKIILNSTP